MELLPAARTAYAILRPGPLAFAHDRQSRAIDDKVTASTGRDSPQCDIEKLTAPRERRVIRNGKVNAHHPEERMQEPLDLTEWQVEEEAKRQCGFNGDVRVLLLPSASTDAPGLPCGDRLR